MSARLTKAQLLAKIAQLEAELGMANTTAAQMERELNAYQVAQRPSRRAQPTRAGHAGQWQETTQCAHVPRPFKVRLAWALAESKRTGVCVKVPMQ